MGLPASSWRPGGGVCAPRGPSWAAAEACVTLNSTTPTWWAHAVSCGGCVGARRYRSLARCAWVCCAHARGHTHPDSASESARHAGSQLQRLCHPMFTTWPGAWHKRQHRVTGSLRCCCDHGCACGSAGVAKNAHAGLLDRGVWLQKRNSDTNAPHTGACGSRTGHRAVTNYVCCVATAWRPAQLNAREWLVHVLCDVLKMIAWLSVGVKHHTCHFLC